ncbi:MAG: NADH-quinone oxidoreductase subunit A [Planctomycetota bacterium]|jgi:NADH-quinone oxidoreductase subunit A
MSEWTSVALYAVLAFAVGLGLLFAGIVFGPRRRQKAKTYPYESGMPLLSGARERFSVHFYLVAILFLLFDVETLFLIPWAVDSAKLGTGALIAVFIFLAVLVFGLLYEWRRRALEWD